MNNESEPKFKELTPLPKQPLAESIRDIILVSGTPAGMFFVGFGAITGNPHSAVAGTVMMASSIGGIVFYSRS